MVDYYKNQKQKQIPDLSIWGDFTSVASPSHHHVSYPHATLSISTIILSLNLPLILSSYLNLTFYPFWAHSFLLLFSDLLPTPYSIENSQGNTYK